MKVSELVNGPPISCESSARIVAVADRMITEGVGSMAVIDDGILVGIVTDRDIVTAVASALTDATAGEIMTSAPDTIDGESGIVDAIYWLNATGYRHLPVTDGADLIGIVSIKDLLWAMNDPAA